MTRAHSLFYSSTKHRGFFLTATRKDPNSHQNEGNHGKTCVLPPRLSVLAVNHRPPLSIRLELIFLPDTLLNRLVERIHCPRAQTLLCIPISHCHTEQKIRKYNHWTQNRTPGFQGNSYHTKNVCDPVSLVYLHVFVYDRNQNKNPTDPL